MFRMPGSPACGKDSLKRNAWNSVPRSHGKATAPASITPSESKQKISAMGLSAPYRCALPRITSASVPAVVTTNARASCPRYSRRDASATMASGYSAFLCRNFWRSPPDPSSSLSSRSCRSCRHSGLMRLVFSAVIFAAGIIAARRAALSWLDFMPDIASLSEAICLPSLASML